MFSSRLPAELAPNALSRAVERARRVGRAILDLTETNPTAVGLPYPADLLGSLADPRSVDLPARPARRDRRARGCRLGPIPRAVVPSTRAASCSPPARARRTRSCSSCSRDPGDAVLVPQPSYPLFELLTRLEAVDRTPYRLDARRRLGDRSREPRRAVTPRTRAMLVVSPNNPTGSMLRADDREWLVATARRARPRAHVRRGVRRLSALAAAGRDVARRLRNAR